MGFIVILVNLAYLVFSQVVGIITYFSLKKILIFAKHTRKLKAFSFAVFLVVLLAPFWDLIIQKGIKTYYENYKMNYVINAYPEKDENGMIESLGVDKKIRGTSSFLESKEASKYLKNTFLITKFLEIYLYDSFIKTKNNRGKITFKNNFKNDTGYARVYFDQDPISYEKISGIEEFKARYQVLTNTKKYYFYNEIVVEFWDKKKNILLATGMQVDFPVKNREKKFRTKYLVWWINAGGGAIELRSLRNHYEIFKKLFGYNISSAKI